MTKSSKGLLAAGPSVDSTAVPSQRSVDSLSQLSVLSHCSKGPRYGFGGAPRFKWMEERFKADQLKKSASSPALGGSGGTAMVEIAGPSHMMENEDAEVADAPYPEEPAEEEEEEQIQHAVTVVSPKRDLEQTYPLGRGCVPRFDGSLDRCLSPRQHAGEPRPKSYGPAQTIGEGTAACFLHSPKYSFGGGKSRVADLEEGAPKMVKAYSATGDLSSLKNRRSKRKNMSRGFGCAARLQVKGGPFEMPISPGPAAYELAREGDKVPDWASSSRLPWGVRTGGRSSLKVPVASDVGPGEYTAEHPFKAAGPSPKIGQTFKGAPDSRKDYPAAGTYDIKSTVGSAVSYSVGPGQRAPLFRATCSPGPVYDPSLKGVSPDVHGASWGTSERVHFSDVLDPDEPPGPGAHNVRREYRASDKPSTGLPRDEKQFRKMGGMGPLGVPAPDHYGPLPGKRLGKQIPIGLPLEPHQELTPAGTDYDPKFVLTKPASKEPKPLCRTAPRKSIFDVSEGGSSGAAEALLKRALQQVAAPKPDKNEAPKFHSSTPSWSMSARRPQKSRADQDLGATMYGAFSSIG
eukprot:gb/GFBE01015006.1/.p1 GENE.gb/GFBE01015006.1/~~gb/GFBE01015006.1/.p1  ORF type:complete len:574 (+),score=76.34 gb/GFBE01015006.1/:1-1722(+)